MAHTEHEDTAVVVKDFKAAVNMTASQLEKWLDTPESKEVGQKNDGAGESTGHQSGRHIIQLLHTKQADYSEGDVAQMKRVISYVARHSAQKPDGDIARTHWRFSLMNWGHDPLDQGHL